MKLVDFLKISMPKVDSDVYVINAIKGYPNGNNILEKLHNYYLGIFNALTTFEGVIDTDMNNIEKDYFEYKESIDRFTSVRAYLIVPKDKFRVRVEDIDIVIEITDKFKEVVSILAEIADYSFSCKDTCLGADCTKDFENINEFAIDGLKLFNADKK